jgi:hypothetical protein
VTEGVEVTEFPCQHLRPGDQTVRLNYRTEDPGTGLQRLWRFAFCEACARASLAAFQAEIDRAFPRWTVAR